MLSIRQADQLAMTLDADRRQPSYLCLFYRAAKFHINYCIKSIFLESIKSPAFNI